MAGKLGKFQMVGFDHWKGLTKTNHISMLFARNAQRASNLMILLLGLHYGNNGYESFLSQFSTKEFDTDDEYTWDIIGSTRRNIPLVEARDEDGQLVDSSNTKTNIGADNAPFYLVFSEDWFSDGEIIVGNLNEIYQFRILGEPRFEGTNAVYKVELFGSNTLGVPKERLMAGERFSKEFAPVEDSLSRKVGNVRFSSPIQMRNEWTTIRKQVKAPGNMLNRKLAIGIPVVDGNGKKTVQNMWMHWVDWEFEREFSEEKNLAITFGRSNRNSNGEYKNFGKSGNAIKTGAGIFEQMSYGNQEYYNTFSLKKLENALYDLSAAKLDFGQRYFVLQTGEKGAIQFHRAVTNMVSGWGAFQINGEQVGAVQKTTSNLHNNSLKAGYQFTEYLAPNGVVIKVNVNPLYDDPVRNKVQHPLGGPAMSYRYDLMDMGTMEQPNIFKCKIKGQEEWRGYEQGMRNPFTGKIDIESMAHDEDSTTMHKMAQFGVCVLDPTRTMSLIPAVLSE